MQVRAIETVTAEGNKYVCARLCVCLQMCTVHVSACLPVLSVTSVWCDCTSRVYADKCAGALAALVCVRPARACSRECEAEMKGRSPICCGVMTVLFGGRKGLVWEQLVPRPVTF